jgi:hypothetical protein
MSVSDEDLKQTATDPRKLLTQESEKLHWNPQFKSLLEPFVPRTAERVLTEPLMA